MLAMLILQDDLKILYTTKLYNVFADQNLNNIK